MLLASEAHQGRVIIARPRRLRRNEFRPSGKLAVLQQALEQIENLCRAVQSLRADVFPKNPRNFAILAEGPVDEIRKLQVDLEKTKLTLGPLLELDSDRERFKDNPRADALLTREYRQPFVAPAESAI